MRPVLPECGRPTDVGASDARGPWDDEPVATARQADLLERYVLDRARKIKDKDPVGNLPAGTT